MTAFTLPIVGAHFRPPAKALLAVLPLNAPLLIEPEPSNPYDENALRVLVSSSTIPEGARPRLSELAEGYGFSLDDIFDVELWHLGYLPRENAAELCASFAGEKRPGRFALSAEGKPQIQFTLEGVQE